MIPALSELVAGLSAPLPLALLGAGGALMACAQHPFVTFPLSLKVLARVAPGLGRDRMTAPVTAPVPGAPRFAILMCAYNEEKVIEAKMANLLALRRGHPDLEILVYVDASSDRTAALLEPYRDRITLHVSTERHGKTYGMNLLVKRARAELLVFTDANIMLDPGVLSALERQFADPAVGCVCGRIVSTNAAESVTAATGTLYLQHDEVLRDLESRTGSVMGAHGGLWALRRAAHRPPPDDIIDDMFVSLSALCDGHRVVQGRDVIGFESAANRMREEWRRKVRIACQAYNVHRLLWPRLREQHGLIVYEYLSHKWMRWLAVFWLGGAAAAVVLALAAAGFPLLGAGLVAAGGASLALGRTLGLPVIAKVADLLVSMAGTGLGVLRSVRGERFQTWTPAASTRESAGQRKG